MTAPAGARGEHVVLPGPQVDAQRPLQFHLILDDQDPGHAGVLGGDRVGAGLAGRLGVACRPCETTLT